MKESVSSSGKDAGLLNLQKFLKFIIFWFLPYISYKFFVISLKRINVHMCNMYKCLWRVYRCASTVCSNQCVFLTELLFHVVWSVTGCQVVHLTVHPVCVRVFGLSSFKTWSQNQVMRAPASKNRTRLC